MKHCICKNTWNRSHKQGQVWEHNIGIFLLHIKPEPGHLVKIMCSFLSMLFAIKELLQLNSSSRRCSNHHLIFFSILSLFYPNWHQNRLSRLSPLPLLGSYTASHFSVPSQFTHIQVSSCVAPRVGVTSTAEIRNKQLPQAPCSWGATGLGAVHRSLVPPGQVCTVIKVHA